MDAPKGSLLGSIDGFESAATQEYPSAITSTSDSATQLTANPSHDATSYSSPSTDSIRDITLQQTEIGALSNFGTTPQAFNVLVCKDVKAGCACFCCKHRIIVNRDMLGCDLGWLRSWLLNYILINACSAPNCGLPHGVLRQLKTEHLFGPQLCSDKDKYRCAVQGCQFFSVRRSGLRRHHAAKHCTQPKRFPCLEPYCKYGGDNGFIRPDKLKEHQKKIHEGKFKPAKALRTIKQAATKPVTE